MGALNVVTLDPALLHAPGSVLRERCREVNLGDPAELELCRRVALELFEVMYASDGAATAANQVGLALRLVVMDPRGGEAGPYVLINPVIVERSETEANGFEGCMSLPGFIGEVPRAVDVRVQAYDLKGALQDFRASGFIARVFQHEIDHLDGYLYADRLQRGSSLIAAGGVARQRAEFALQTLLA